MAKKVKVDDLTVTLPSLPEKPTKLGFFKMILDGIKKNKDNLKKYKEDKAEYDKKISDVAEKLKNNPDVMSKITGEGTKTGSKIGKTAKILGGGAVATEGIGAAGFGKSPILDPALEFAKNKLKLNKGGIVAPKMGGKPSHKAKKSSKSIAKKYFKGTF